MPPLARSSSNPNKLCHLGALLVFVGLVWLAAIAGTATPSDAAARGSAHLLQCHPECSADSTSTASEAPTREDLGDRVDGIDDHAGAPAATEVTESESDADMLHIVLRARLPWRGGDLLRVRFDPFVVQGRLRLSLTRAPPRRHCALA